MNTPVYEYSTYSTVYTVQYSIVSQSMSKVWAQRWCDARPWQTNSLVVLRRKRHTQYYGIQYCTVLYIQNNYHLERVQYCSVITVRENYGWPTRWNEATQTMNLEMRALQLVEQALSIPKDLSPPAIEADKSEASTCTTTEAVLLMSGLSSVYFPA